jgi:hypothetical protein
MAGRSGFDKISSPFPSQPLGKRTPGDFSVTRSVNIAIDNIARYTNIACLLIRFDACLMLIFSLLLVMQFYSKYTVLPLLAGALFLAGICTPLVILAALALGRYLFTVIMPLSVLVVAWTLGMSAVLYVTSPAKLFPTSFIPIIEVFLLTGFLMSLLIVAITFVLGRQIVKPFELPYRELNSSQFALGRQAIGKFLEKFHISRIRLYRGPVIGTSLILLCVASALASLWVSSLCFSSPGVCEGGAQAFATTVGALVLLYVSRVSYLRGRARFTIEAQKFLEWYGLRPMLFLRSFSDDDRKAGLVASLERSLAKEISLYGPFVGLADPSQFRVPWHFEYGSLPFERAGRGGPEEDASIPLPRSEKHFERTWQSLVAKWVLESAKIVLLPGLTQWVRWELRLIVKTGKIRKLILVFPPRVSGAELELRWQHLARSLSETAWGSTLASIDPRGLIALTFLDDETVICMRGRGKSPAHYSLALRFAWLMTKNQTETGPYGSYDRRDEYLITVLRGVDANFPALEDEGDLRFRAENAQIEKLVIDCDDRDCD